MPEIFVCRTFEGESRATRETIRLAQGENRFCTIAVLHPHKKPVYALAKEFGGRVLDSKKLDMISPGIIVSTIHRVKGLEFDLVVVADATSATFPETIDARRALYVGVTRTTHRLTLAAPGEVTKLVT